MEKVVLKLPQRWFMMKHYKLGGINKRLKNKNVNMQGFQERLKGLVVQCESICEGLRMQV